MRHHGSVVFAQSLAPYESHTYLKQTKEINNLFLQKYKNICVALLVYEESMSVPNRVESGGLTIFVQANRAGPKADGGDGQLVFVLIEVFHNFVDQFSVK